MTEADWLTSEDPVAMLVYFFERAGYVPGQEYFSDRKLRLFACACCRQPWPQGGPNERVRHVIGAAERLADEPDFLADPQDYEGVASHAKEVGTIVLIEGNGAHAAREWVTFSGRDCTVQRTQAALLREIVGNPFRPVKLSLLDRSRMVGWEGGIIRRVAQAVYEDRAFDGLPVLADALEEAGCPSPAGCRTCGGSRVLCRTAGPDAPDDYRECHNCAVLSHLRSPGPHVRGCWALDLILGKE